MDDLIEEKIARNLKLIVEKFSKGEIIPATVLSVNETDFTCDVESDDEITYPSVLYKSIAGGEVDVVMQPKQNSRVWIGKVADSDDWIVIRCGDIDKLHVKIGSSQFKVDGDGIVMNGGNFGGLVKRDGVKAQLNKIENDLAMLKNAFKTWVVVPSDGGGALKAVASTWANTALATTANADIENEKVKQ